MTAYPKNILEIVKNARHAFSGASSNASGRDVNFSCACFVEILGNVDLNGDGTIEDLSFRSNGCGYMIAAAETVAEYINGQSLSDLHGLGSCELSVHIQTRLGEIDKTRVACVDTVLSALKKLFADHRSKRIQEFTGEKALVCTCFGVSEEIVESILDKHAGITVNQIAAEFRAGSGCGSCRMLLQEMVDASASNR